MDIREIISEANKKPTETVINACPVWVDIHRAGEAVKGLQDRTVLHSGPQIKYRDMRNLHRRGVVRAVLFEGWAKDKESTRALANSGEIEFESAMKAFDRKYSGERPV